MKRHVQVFLSSLLLGAACAATPVLAQDADAKAATPAPAISVSGNVAIVSQYRFRGISRSAGDLAIQGGLTLAHFSSVDIDTSPADADAFYTSGGTPGHELTDGAVVASLTASF